MKSILITRHKEEAITFATLLEEAGFEPLFFPTITISPMTSWETPNVRQYDGLIFTSVNAVKFFYSEMLSRKPEIAHILQTIKHFSIGEKTYLALKHYGIKSFFFSDKGTSEDLASQLVTLGVKGKTFLFVRGSLSRTLIPNTIVQHGGTCDDLSVYQNTPPPSSEVTLIRNLLLNNKLDWITFFSPSAVENFFTMISPNAIDPSISFAVIGETTSQTLIKSGFYPDVVPSHPTAEAMVKAIKDHQQNKKEPM